MFTTNNNDNNNDNNNSNNDINIDMNVDDICNVSNVSNDYDNDDISDTLLRGTAGGRRRRP